MPITPKNGNIPNEKEYQLIVNSSEKALLYDILSLKDNIKKVKSNILQSGDLKACFFDQHLYRPLMHVAKSSKIQIAPIWLNESEFQFVKDLHEHLPKQNGSEFYLLRNQSRGKGIGFFEAGNFYPDFLLWKVQGTSNILRLLSHMA